MHDTPFEQAILGERPELEAALRSMSREVWPEFLLHADLPGWSSLFAELAPYQLLLLDATGRLAGAAHTAPLPWDGTLMDLPTSLDEVLDRALAAHEARGPSTALCALAAMVAPGHQRQGLSSLLVRWMRDHAAGEGLPDLIAPVRPILKEGFPLVPMESYALWRSEEQEPFDPWIRVHWRLGAEILRVEPAALVVEGSVADWEEWTGREFPGSGAYTVPGALRPVQIDRERDVGRYEDPNLWMRHRTGGRVQ
jgi:GNAT superfamily N-acetyltransferase